MINQDVLAYIRAQEEEGVSRDTIKKSLATGGWSEADMTEAFAMIDGKPLVPAPPESAPAPEHATPDSPQEPPKPVPSLATISTEPSVGGRSMWPWVVLLVILLLAGAFAAAYAFYPDTVRNYIGFAPAEPTVEEPDQGPPPIFSPEISTTSPSTTTLSTSTTTPRATTTTEVGATTTLP